MPWWGWLLVSFAALDVLIVLAIWAMCYVGGVADDMAERARQKRYWNKPKIIGWNGERAAKIAERFRIGDYPYASRHEMWLMKKGW